MILGFSLISYNKSLVIHLAEALSFPALSTVFIVLNLKDSLVWHPDSSQFHGHLWWGFFFTDDLTLSIESAKDTEKRKCLSGQGAPVWCRPKTLGHENQYPHWEKARRLLVCGGFW